ncbi:hypothetical protein M440DRAFT_1215272 [Trichoderma longibrachiatum ATCC 18648]|uniref:FHA domain-containing protein n=1 Tax=Trichoderma longibrachiatum ATCC 18648 TaxID=983965 RepID=A0A2T4C7L0_TRILO|nr:hypothetical protein M440DRAFT_1215272 [Trichoderma longibrachiatum ATCC 18648]
MFAARYCAVSGTSIHIPWLPLCKPPSHKRHRQITSSAILNQTLAGGGLDWAGTGDWGLGDWRLALGRHNDGRHSCSKGRGCDSTRGLDRGEKLSRRSATVDAKPLPARGAWDVDARTKTSRAVSPVRLFVREH